MWNFAARPSSARRGRRRGCAMSAFSTRKRRRTWAGNFFPRMADTGTSPAVSTRRARPPRRLLRPAAAYPVARHSRRHSAAQHARPPSHGKTPSPALRFPRRCPQRTPHERNAPMRDACKRYIPLVPPFHKAPAEFSPAEARAYFDWYLSHLDGRCEYLKEFVYQTSDLAEGDAGLHAGVAAAPVGLVSPTRAGRLAQGSAAAPGRAARGRVGAGICPRHLQAVASHAQHKDRISDPGHRHVCRKDICRPVSTAAVVDVQKRAPKRHIRQYAAADRLCADRETCGATRFPSRSTRSSSPSI